MSWYKQIRLTTWLGILPGSSPQRSASSQCCRYTRVRGPNTTIMLPGHEHNSHHRPRARSTSQRITNTRHQTCERQVHRLGFHKRFKSNDHASADSRSGAATSGPTYVCLLCLVNKSARRPPPTSLPLWPAVSS
jgi:hypothetical protein